MTRPSFPEAAVLEPLLGAVARLNRTIVSDDMDRAADLVDAAVGVPGRRYCYPSGAEYGSWIVPPSWNVREAFLSDGARTLASYADHPLFLAPYSAPFEGWVARDELKHHLVLADRFDDAFAYQYGVAYDFTKRLQRWEISVPRRLADRLDRDRYYVKIDVDVKPGAMNVLEYVAPGQEDTCVALLAHLCHPGQCNDGLSGVLGGIALMRRLRQRPHRLNYKLLIMPETIGSCVHVVAQRLSTADFTCAIFLETLGAGERLFLKKSRSGDAAIDTVLGTIVRERPEIGLHEFFEGYRNDELVFNFPNVNIPSVGIQYYPYPEYHTSRDGPDIIDWDKMGAAVELVEELFSRLEADKPIRFRYPGPPYLSRYRLYADAVRERERFAEISNLLNLCDGEHTLLDICARSSLRFDEVIHFFHVLERAGLLA